MDAPADQLHLTRRLIAGIDYPATYRAFVEVFPGEEACLRYVEALRRRDGFVCPACGFAGEPWRASRGRLARRACRHQASLTAGTAFDKTRTPLTTWFEAAWHLATAKNGMSAQAAVTWPVIEAGVTHGYEWWKTQHLVGGGADRLPPLPFSYCPRRGRRSRPRAHRRARRRTRPARTRRLQRALCCHQESAPPLRPRQPGLRTAVNSEKAEDAAFSTGSASRPRSAAGRERCRLCARRRPPVACLRASSCASSRTTPAAAAWSSVSRRCRRPSGRGSPTA